MPPIVRSEDTRLVAARGLGEIAKRNPDTFAETAPILAELLARHEPDRFRLNSVYLSELVELKAVEFAETIERAFSAGVVDEGYIGNWEQVRQELGVRGLGLPQPKQPYNSVGDLRRTWIRAETKYRRQEAQETCRKAEKTEAKVKPRQSPRAGLKFALSPIVSP